MSSYFSSERSVIEKITRLDNEVKFYLQYHKVTPHGDKDCTSKNQKCLTVHNE